MSHVSATSSRSSICLGQMRVQHTNVRCTHPARWTRNQDLPEGKSTTCHVHCTSFSFQSQSGKILHKPRTESLGKRLLHLIDSVGFRLDFPREYSTRILRGTLIAFVPPFLDCHAQVEFALFGSFALAENDEMVGPRQL